MTAYYDTTELRRATDERERLFAAAQSAIRSRDELLAVVSHDLRNPLGSVAMAVGMLERVVPTDESGHKMLRHVATISRAVDRMERLIADLLDMASIDAGRLAIDVKANEVAMLLRDAGELMEPLAQQKAVVLEVASAQAPPAAVHCDRGRVIQVFSNLIGNAIKFTPERGRIRVAAHARGATIEFVVTDTGPGIAEEQLGRIFDRYWQGKDAQGRGVGLGLSIAKGIIEAHRGSLWVDSTPGQGATFHFTLPAEGLRVA